MQPMLSDGDTAVTQTGLNTGHCSEVVRSGVGYPRDGFWLKPGQKCQGGLKGTGFGGDLCAEA